MFSLLEAFANVYVYVVAVAVVDDDVVVGVAVVCLNARNTIPEDAFTCLKLPMHPRHVFQTFIAPSASWISSGFSSDSFQ